MKYDCPHCGVSLRWRYTPTLTLEGQRRFFPLHARTVCPDCRGELLIATRPTPKYINLLIGTYIVTLIIYKFTEIKFIGYISIFHLIFSFLGTFMMIKKIKIYRDTIKNKTHILTIRSSGRKFSSGPRKCLFLHWPLRRR